MSTVHVTHGARLVAHDRPDGRLIEVLAGELRSDSDNTLFMGSADECVREMQKWHIPTRLMPTKWRELDDEEVQVDHFWLSVTA